MLRLVLLSFTLTQSWAAVSYLPLTLEPNQGQADKAVKYIAHGQRYTVHCLPEETLIYAHGASMPVHLRFNGANPFPLLTGVDKLAGIINYFRSSNPENWHTNIPTFANVKYQRLYPGIDLVFHAHRDQLEFDLDVAPGADPSVISFAIEGARALQLSGNGALLINTEGGTLILNNPRIFQRVAGNNVTVNGKFILRNTNRVAFALGPYDKRKPLVIDPVLAYSTYLGSGPARYEDSIEAIATDAAGNLYIAGGSGPGLPTTPGAVQGGENYSDGFVAKLDPTGSMVVYLTYLTGTCGRWRAQPCRAFC